MLTPGGNIVTTAIITNGLFCSPVERSGIITTFFSLYVANEPETQGGGGWYPRDAWNKISSIQNFYKPVPNQFEDEWQYRRLEDIDVRKIKHVKMVIKIGEYQHEKEYVVRERIVKTILSVGSVVNVTRAKIAIGVSNVKKIKHDISIKINRLRAIISKEK